jgi:hypothetical protein
MVGWTTTLDQPVRVIREPKARPRGGVTSKATNLSPVERDLLVDPDWGTEDDADAMVALRRRGEKRSRLSRL